MAINSENTLRDQPYHKLTDWAKEKLKPRWFFHSKYFQPNEVGDGGAWISKTYRRPKREGEIKGKLKIKAAKRARVKAMKKAQGAR